MSPPRSQITLGILIWMLSGCSGSEDRQLNSSVPIGQETTSTTGSASSGSGGGEKTECAQSDPGWASPVTPGSKLKHLEAVDAFGEDFNLCKLAGKPIVIDLVATWCGPCASWSRMLAGQAEADIQQLDAEGQAFSHNLQDAINSGQLEWVTLVLDPGTASAAAEWHEMYPNDNVHVVAPTGDDASKAYSYFQAGNFPAFHFVDADFTWHSLHGWPFDDLPAEWIEPPSEP